VAKAIVRPGTHSGHRSKQYRLGVDALLDSPELKSPIAELEATRWTGHPGYPIRAMVDMALIRAVYTILDWTGVVRLVAEHAELQRVLGCAPSLDACYRFTVKLRQHGDALARPHRRSAGTGRGRSPVRTLGRRVEVALPERRVHVRIAVGQGRPAAHADPAVHGPLEGAVPSARVCRARFRSVEERVGDVVPAGAPDRAGTPARRPDDPGAVGDGAGGREGRGGGRGVESLGS